MPMTNAAAANVDNNASGTEFLGHPKGLYVCFATELWERFSFFGMKFLLLLYLTKYHFFSDAMGLEVLGAYAGLVYLLPLAGGMVADRYLGMRKAVLFGGVLLSLGHILMAVEGHEAVNYAAGTVLQSDLTLATGDVLVAGTILSKAVMYRDTAALNVFFVAMSLIVVGVGFLKPNISTIVGRLYAIDDPRRDSGFMIFYLGINAGGFAATIVCGWLGENYGWNYGFGAAGIGMIIGLISFARGQKHLLGHAEPLYPGKLKTRVLGPLNVEWLIYVATLPAIAVIWVMLQREPIVLLTQNVSLIIAIVGLILYSMVYKKQDQSNRLPFAIAGVAALSGVYATSVNLHFMPGSVALAENILYGSIVLIVGFIVYGFKTHNSAEFGRTVALMVLVVFSIAFWAMFQQSAGSMTLFADRVVDRTVGATTITAAQFGSLNTGFIILLAIPFAVLWAWLGKRNLEPATPVKFGLGIIQAGLGFGALVFGAQFPDQAGQVAMIWLVLAYLLLTTGELFLSPVGLSAVTKLSIPNVVGVSMGTWLLATALSETVAARMGRIAAIDTSSIGTTTDAATMLNTYTQLFELLMWFGLAMGVTLLVISPLLRRVMHGID